MNKQEAVNQLRESLLKMVDNIEDENDFNKGYRYATQHCFDIINQLDEPEKAPEPEPWKPEKPVIPQFVADWIEKCRELKVELCDAMYINGYDEKSGWIEDNSETFAKALLYGYEVEKEKLYTVELPNPQSSLENVHIMLVKTANDRVVISEIADSHVNLRNDIKLTEAEIKKDFDWAWQFAEEVTE